MSILCNGNVLSTNMVLFAFDKKWNDSIKIQIIVIIYYAAKALLKYQIENKCESKLHVFLVFPIKPTPLF